ncbi:hypothetical protein FOL47_011219 [Perkinsus chesapeaki]|uniref:Cytochrome P450 n=1 Tax=Perkinsus chesapeaki TaxID=330153 RepID=A0A7J6KZ92_PERCH|nr:hypothetical protein FOL47_011219 [Perkinsus chesapeaki]
MPVDSLDFAGLEFISKYRSLLRSRGALILGVGAASFLILKVVKSLRRQTYFRTRFGGPSGFFPLLGFLPRSLDDLFQALEMYADKYGDIYAIRSLGSDIIVVSSPELVDQVLRDRPKTYMRSINKDRIMPVPGIFSAEGEEWKRNRRLGAPAFNDKNTDAMIPDMTRVSMKLIHQLRSLSIDGRIIWSPTEWLPLCTLDVLCVTTFSHDYDFLKADMNLGYRSRDIQEAIINTLDGSGYAARLSAFPWMTRDRFPWNLNPMIKNLHAGVRFLNTVCDEMISERRNEHKRGERNRHDLLDKLLSLKHEDLRGNLITFLMAGSETTAMTVAWCLYFLSINPDIQSKARSEVDELGHDPEIISDIENMPFIQACIQETLRNEQLRPPAAFIMHETAVTASLDGITIPAGTLVATLSRKAMTKDYQGGMIFKPDRWFVEGTSNVDLVRVRDHLAFGGGPRQCPGQSMASKEATVIMALILRYFDEIKLHPCAAGEVRGEVRFTYVPANLEIEMRERNF